jgi:hypothetical protein
MTQLNFNESMITRAEAQRVAWQLHLMVPEMERLRVVLHRARLDRLATEAQHIRNQLDDLMDAVKRAVADPSAGGT